MNGDRVRALMRKEWLDLLKSKTVLVSLALMPLILAGTFIAFVVSTSGLELPSQDAEELRRLMPPEMRAMDMRDAGLILLSQQFMFMLLITPLALPGTIAANSIVGEKVERTLEPLLSTPLTTTEILVGKGVVAVAPAVAATWVSWILVIAAVAIFGRPAVLLSIVAPRWILAMLLHAPLLATLSTLIAMIASSRTNDPKVAQSWSVVVVVPLIGLGASLLIARVLVDATLLLWSAGALLFVVLGGLRLAVRVFARETILTRWK